MAFTKKETTGEVKVFEQQLDKKNIVGMQRADERRMDELKVEVRVKDLFKKKLVRSRLQYGKRGR